MNRKLNCFSLSERKSSPNDTSKAFTLLELIVVIIIIGILATLGFTQYSLVVEKGRTGEAKAILGQVRSAEIAYNQENGTFVAVGNIYVGAPQACTSTHYFSYYYSIATCCGTSPAGTPVVYAARCTSSGKTPNYTANYLVCIAIESGLGGACNGGPGW